MCQFLYKTPLLVQAKLDALTFYEKLAHSSELTVWAFEL